MAHLVQKLLFEDVNIVVLVKILLLQCVVAQLDQGHSAMHVGLCGQTRDGYNDFNTFYMQIGNGRNIVREASKDYILNFWIYFVIGFCYEFASLEGFWALHVSSLGL
ncbi:uncharacterized protein LOC114268631 [Camellia sinensis]|uniref:uncharacterized protein LOC114268631 n=1 Tax=Camellia sinensis TaxID=4442 RepID=UPI0010357EB4|nr:uncharacterized protein LOC114268631 [Camellia sinensis]